MGSGEEPRELGEEPRERNEEPRELKDVRTLVIEDSAFDATILRRTLARTHHNPFQLTFTKTLAEGLIALAETDYALVLADLGLPDAKGLDIIRRVTAQAPAATVVVLSGRDDQGTAEQAMTLGAQDFIVKGTFDSATLVRSLRLALERQRLQGRHLSAAPRAAVSAAAATSTSDAAKVRELASAKQHLEQLAHHDELTGVLNRRGFEAVLRESADRVARRAGSSYLLLVDLDDFKGVNDRFGHDIGDQVLVQVAHQIRRALRPADTVCRVGGDEFLVLLGGVDNDVATKVAERVRVAISTARVSVPGTVSSVQITASIGAMNLGADDGSIEAVLRRTHPALYRSKRGGKNRLSLAGDQRFGPGDTLPRFVESMQYAETFIVARQEVMEVATDTIMGHEYLTRTAFPEFESPIDYFRLAKDVGVLRFVDLAALEACTLAASRHVDAGRCFINIFPSTFAAVDVEEVRSRLAHVALDRICLELNEHYIDDPSLLVSSARSLRASGVQIAIDDVGFGRSSLETLLLVEPDVVKVDRKLVSGASINKDQRRVLERLLRTISALGADVVAEGVEDAADRQVLADMGVRLAQGWFWGKAIHEADW